MQSDGEGEAQIQRWLEVLRDGTESEKLGARRGLAHVFEQRGLFDEAIELLESNVRTSVCSAETFRWLARLYRAQGDEDRASQAMAEASRYQLAPLARTPSAPIDRRTVPDRSWTLRQLAPYLLLIVGLGIVVGVGLWVALPLAKP